MPALPLLTLLNRITTELTLPKKQPLPSSSTANKNNADDPILQCPLSTLFILHTHPVALIKLAHDKIHSYPFSEVPACWRRLYTDASIREATRVSREGIEHKTEEGRSGGTHGGGAGEGEEGDWIQHAVRLLDMAVIITGAPRREEMIEDLLSALQDYVEEQEQEKPGPPKKKRRKGNNEGGTFTTAVNNCPEIRQPIATVSNMSLHEFETHLKTAQPLIIRGALEHWPALHERPWKNPEYILKKTFGGRRLVPVEIGRSYTDAGWGQKIITVKEFMDKYMFRSRSSSDEDEDEGIAYLAQYDLFAQIPSLRNDISVPDFCYTSPLPPAPGTPLASKPPQSRLEEPILNTWFGPVGTVSPLHTDPYHNILCQVVGKKYVRLYAPEESGRVYPRGKEAGGVDMSNTSEVDVEGWDEERWPLFGRARFIEGVVGEGECLYVPVGWWHYVRALTASWSVSFWWN